MRLESTTLQNKYGSLIVCKFPGSFNLESFSSLESLLWRIDCCSRKAEPMLDSTEIMHSSSWKSPNMAKIVQESQQQKLK